LRPTATPALTETALCTDEIEVVVSDRAEDIDDVLSVVHDGFVGAGYISPQPSGRRMHPAYLNPGTVFLLARIHGVPVGSVIIVQDGPFGLPSDRAFAEENDAFRAASDLPLVEGGSFVIREEWRGQTRRIFTRLISALVRHGAAEMSGSLVVSTCDLPQERFYGSILGMHRVAGPRPLYGVPALLIHPGTMADLARHCGQRETSGQRTMDRLIRERHPWWLSDRRTGQPLPPRWLGGLVEEAGIAHTLASQLRLLSDRHPKTLHSIFDEVETASRI
jgi:hypothetical protein